MGLLKPIQDYIDGLVHPFAQQDALTAARHRAFIATRLLGSFVGLAAFPLYLVLRGVPSALEVAFLAWLVLPIVVAYFLSRTGRYEKAHILSSLSLTGLVAVIAFKTGGILSFAAIWLVVVPLESALSASWRVVTFASTFALAATGLLLLANAADLVPDPTTAPSEQGAFATLGILFASLYVTGLALVAARAEFPRANGAKAGTALGVWIVKRLEALHGGKGKIRGTLGEETQINMPLPFDCDATPPVMKRGRTTHPSFRLERQQAAIAVRKRA